ncbi:MAG TPA: HAD hydrolase family protein [Gemmataceae bacterium]|nr:HAD hydrolase family protein [Gemmataceae bacterium]
MARITLPKRCQPIRFLLLDVDGVLTDGSIVYSSRGDDIKAFHVRDGSGLKMWLGVGHRAGILSGRRSETVLQRGIELGLRPIVQGTDDKVAALESILADLGVSAEETCYIGDDVIDLPVLERVGLAVAVEDACPDAQAAAHYVTAASGGRGAVRECIELILKAQNAWDAARDAVLHRSRPG